MLTVSAPTIVALLIACALTLSATGKLLGLQAFRRVLQVTYGLNDRAALGLTVLIPTTEIVSIACLLAPPARSVGFVSSALLFLGSAVASSMAVAAGRVGDCGCFGKLRTESLGSATVVRALGLFAASVFGLALALG